MEIKYSQPDYPIHDDRFKVALVNKSDRPNLLAYLDLHQCYAETSVIDDYEKFASWSEEKLGELIVDKCVKYQHWGILESPNMSFICEGFPHSVIVQARTHRVGVTFNVTSQRYTGKRVIKLADYIFSQDQDFNTPGLFEKVADLFYFRPEGDYVDREGNKVIPEKL